jgi:DNA-binding NtrC family response regulator
MDDAMEGSMVEQYSNRFSILFVDDEPSVLSMLRRVFRDQPYVIHAVNSGKEALALLQRVPVHTAVIDLAMPEMDGLSLLSAINMSHPNVTTIILTGNGGVPEAVEAVKRGAADFLEKPMAPDVLRIRMAELFEIWKTGLSRGDEKDRAGFHRLIGDSAPMLRVKALIARVASGQGAVLIDGETGTGKELAAKAVHQLGPRPEGPFVPVDCAAVNDTIIENELFGHVKEAFTGACAVTLGLVRTADRGSLFLDEVGELPLSVQAKLLRTIQENEVRPLGSSKSHRVDIRIIAATNLDLANEVHAGRFRKDLYYRINVFQIRMPPLRARKEDIPRLARFFVDRFGTDSGHKIISNEAIVCLQNYEWPGNVRELENVMCRAVSLAKGKSILPEDLSLPVDSRNEEDMNPSGIPNGQPLSAYERTAIQNALGASRGNRRKAAQFLRIGEATLYRKIRKYFHTDEGFRKQGGNPPPIDTVTKGLSK